MLRLLVRQRPGTALLPVPPCCSAACSTYGRLPWSPHRFHGTTSQQGDDPDDNPDERDEYSEEWIPPSHGPASLASARASSVPRPPAPKISSPQSARNTSDMKPPSSPTADNGDESLEEHPARNDSEQLLSLSDVDLTKLDWDALQVEPTTPSSPSASLDDDDGCEDMIDVEAYVKRVMEQSNINVEDVVEVEEDSWNEEEGWWGGVDEGEMMELEDAIRKLEEDERMDNNAVESEEAERERRELRELGREIAELERMEQSGQRQQDVAPPTGRLGGRRQQTTGLGIAGLLDDDPTAFSMDDFLQDRATADRDAPAQYQERVGLNDDYDKATENADKSAAPDWLAARRSRLGINQQSSSATQSESAESKPVGMLTPTDAEAARQLDSEIPVIEHTLLTADEITNSLTVLGADDIVVLRPDAGPSGTTGLDADGLIVATGRGSSHLRVLADSVVRNLRARRLHRRGIIGAMLGAEGGEDRGTTRRNRRRQGGLASNRLDDGWMIVDCGNYAVHLQDEDTRRAINLEGLWGGREGRALRAVDFTDEDAVDDYIAANPVPDDYARATLMSGARAEFALPIFGRQGRGDRWKPKIPKKRSKGRGRR